jgi:hypothetical protein
VDEIHTFSPDGRELLVRHSGETWIVCCGPAEAHRHSLDAAIIEVLRASSDVVAHTRDLSGFYYDATWVRLTADAIQERIGRGQQNQS